MGAGRNTFPLGDVNTYIQNVDFECVASTKINVPLVLHQGWGGGFDRWRRVAKIGEILGKPGS